LPPRPAKSVAAAFREIMGDDWKPYVAPVDASQSVPRQAAPVEFEAFVHGAPGARISGVPARRFGTAIRRH
jgi:hypothetical protein